MNTINILVSFTRSKPSSINTYDIIIII